MVWLGRRLGPRLPPVWLSLSLSLLKNAVRDPRSDLLRFPPYPGPSDPNLLRFPAVPWALGPKSAKVPPAPWALGPKYHWALGPQSAKVPPPTLGPRPQICPHPGPSVPNLLRYPPYPEPSGPNLLRFRDPGGGGCAILRIFTPDASSSRLLSRDVCTAAPRGPAGTHLPPPLPPRVERQTGPCIPFAWQSPFDPSMGQITRRTKREALPALHCATLDALPCAGERPRARAALPSGSRWRRRPGGLHLRRRPPLPLPTRSAPRSARAAFFRSTSSDVAAQHT